MPSTEVHFVTRMPRPRIQIDFESLVADSPNPYVLLDRDLTLVWMNEAYLRVTMRKREDIVGQKMFDAFPSDPDSESYKLLNGSFDRVLQTCKPDEIALIRYDIRNPDGSMDAHFWSATHTPYLNDDGTVEYILQHTVDVTELENLRQMRDGMGVVRRAKEVQAKNLSLEEETNRLKSLVEQAPGFVAVLSGPTHTFVVANEAYRRLVGRQDLVGRDLVEALPEVIDQGFAGLLDEVRATGKPYVGRRHRTRLDHPESGPAELFLDFIYQPIFGADGNVLGVFVQGHDVTEEVESSERQKLLINELNHRVKNTLSIVQGLAMQSFRQLPDSAQARETFEARLNALAAAHSLLTDRRWESAQLIDTLRNSMAATVGEDIERVDIDGPDIALRPQTAVSVAMLVHELSTNAIKYGALLEPSGQISIRWDIAEEGDFCALKLVWSEMGGPPVNIPERVGFGTRLIRNGLSAERDAAVELDYRPEGLRCTITASLPCELT